MKKITVRNILDKSSKDEDFIIAIRSEADPSMKDQLFNQMFFNVHGPQKQSWDVTIRKYIRWRIKQSKVGFGIYNDDDLYQRCLFSFYNAACNKFELGRDVKFSTYVYTAIEKTVNRVSCELRKKKRTVGMKAVSKVKTKDKETGEETEKEVEKEIRVSPKYFTDSIHAPHHDNSKMSLGDTIPDDVVEPLSESQSEIVELIHKKCKERLNEMQLDILFNGEIYKTTSVHALALKYNKSEPTISAIKKRKIWPVLKQIKAEIIEELKCKHY